MKNIFFLALLLFINLSLLQGQEGCPITSIECLLDGYQLGISLGTEAHASQYYGEVITITGDGWSTNTAPLNAAYIELGGIYPPVNCESGQFIIQIGEITCYYDSGILSPCVNCQPIIECPSNILCNGIGNSGGYLQLNLSDIDLANNIVGLRPNISVFGGGGQAINGIYSYGNGDYYLSGHYLTIPITGDMGEDCPYSVQIEIAGKLCSYEDGILSPNCLPFYHQSVENESACDQLLANCILDYTDLLEEQEENIECKAFLGGCNSADGIYRAGRLSIGTDATLSSARLIVKEGVLTDRTKVELCEYGYWCDYVFKENYELINLDSLQSFITRNKCLPGFLSASELVEQGSFGLKEVTLKQQEKIEEIYLHLLRMTEEVDALVDELDQLQKENKRLKKFGSLTIFAGGSN